MCLHINNNRNTRIILCACLCARSVDRTSCEFLIDWKTRSACAVKQREVEVVNGTIQVPDTGVSLSLGALYFR